MKHFIFLLLVLSLAHCATDPTASTSVSGASIFTYETGDVIIVTNSGSSAISKFEGLSTKYLPSITVLSSRTILTVGAVAVDYPVGQTSGEKVQSTSFAPGVTLTFSPSVTFTNCPSATLLSANVSADGLSEIWTYSTNACEATGVSVSYVKATASGQSSSNSASGLTQHMVFVRSATNTGNLGGLSGADSLCAATAAAGSRTSSLSGTWHAILSDSTTSVKDRLTFSAGAPIVNALGNTVTSAGSGLWNTSSTPLSATIQWDQNGTFVNSIIMWTGTNANGTASGSNCTNWTSSSALISATEGDTAAVIEEWISAALDQDCSNSYNLYCVNSNN